MTSIRRFALGATALLFTLGAASGAWGQTAPLQVSIREALLSADGSTRLVVAVTGDAVTGTLSAANFGVTEVGEAVSGLNVEPLSETNVQPVTVALVMDLSVTAGQVINDAKAAARTFVNQLPSNVRVALITFSTTPALRVPFTSDRARVVNVINGLQAGGRTAFFDALALAARELNGVPGAQHNIVAFADGEDNNSQTTLGQAVTAVQGAKAPVTTVGLQTTVLNPQRLQQLAAAVKGGKYVPVGQSAQLASAFQQVAEDIASQYVVSYVSDRQEPKDLKIDVTVQVGSVRTTDSSTVINTRTGEAPAGQGPQPYKPKALVGFFAGETGKYVGIGAAVVAVLLFAGMIFWAPGRGKAATVLQRGLRLYSRADRRKEKVQSEGFLGGTAVGRRAVELVEKVPRSEAYEQKLQLLLDRAAWPLRATEFAVLQIGGAIAGALIGFGLLGRWWLGIVLLVGGALIPRMVLAQRVAKREALFLSQLPDTLQLLAGSLQAGYGFMQAIDTVAREASPPASTEFARVLAEARLGMPIDEALNAMAERVGGEDFRWVVLAINIQRQVGGNLAALLTTVANTLREREYVRRQIKVLSAEGRLSAVILVALPFLLAGYISVVNPGYLQQLTEVTIGKIMIVGGIVLMAIGIAWMRKIIKIDV
ncbi:MAG: type II secretion system F family protein [Actinomycetota bacterium]